MMWWNTSYLFRRNLALSVLDPIPAGHPVSCKIDSSLLYTLNKVRLDLQDIVVVATTAESQTFVPLPTSAAFVQNKILIQFNTYLPIFSGTNYNYYVYYGNKNLTNAPSLPTYSGNPWPLHVDYTSSQITYTRPDEEWVAGVSTTPNAKAAFVFTGTSFQLLAAQGLDAGIVSVQVDNHTPVQVDLYANSADTITDVYTFAGLLPDYHTVRIINTGLSNRASSNKKIALAGFNYLGYLIATDAGEEVSNLNWTSSIGGKT